MAGLRTRSGETAMEDVDEKGQATPQNSPSSSGVGTENVDAERKRNGIDTEVQAHVGSSLSGQETQTASTNPEPCSAVLRTGPGSEMLPELAGVAPLKLVRQSAYVKTLMVAKKLSKGARLRRNRQLRKAKELTARDTQLVALWLQPMEMESTGAATAPVSLFEPHVCKG